MNIEQDTKDIRSLIYVIRGQQVMLDRDLAMLYGYEVKRLNEQVKRNIGRFPDDFMFKLTETEVPESLRSQFATLNESGNRRGTQSKYLPYAFTEQGIYMLATVLKKNVGVDVKIYTFANSRLTKTDIANFNAQYPTLTVTKTQVFHDRFLILDGKTGYFIGASIKDAGKKCFGITLINDPGLISSLLDRVKRI